MKKILMTTLAAGGLLAIALTGTTQAQDPYAMADESWISLSGEVEKVHPNSFELDYGGGMVTVEMDDGDRDADAYKLLKGDKVTVTGRVDDDLFETTSIEAGTVYVEKIGTYFYASSVDEEDHFVTIYTPIVSSTGIIQGTVTEVDDEEFVIDSGLTKLTVEVDEMPYNPLDDKGYQKIAVGDVVSVAGELDYDLFEGREFEATSVTTIVDISKDSSQSR